MKPAETTKICSTNQGCTNFQKKK